MRRNHLNRTNAVLLALLLACQAISQVQSSYLDDYFLPTAKLALNKLQQTLTPSQAIEASSQVSANRGSEAGEFMAERQNSTPESTSPAATIATSEQPMMKPTIIAGEAGSDEDSRKIQDSPQSNEPERGDFVKIETINPAPATEPNSAPSEADTPATSSSAPVAAADDSSISITISSTQATDVDPTSASSVEVAESSAPVSNSNERQSVDQLNSLVSVPETPAPNSASPSDTGAPVVIAGETGRPQASDSGNSINSEPPQPETPAVVAPPSSSPAAAASGASELEQSPTKAAKSSEEAAREVEAEAVAAVDASIGFGDPFSALGDTCYDEYGNARYCEPEFENVAFERQVEVSSECGQPASRFCTAHQLTAGSGANPAGDQVRNCHICDTQQPKKRHPASYLTDMNNANSPTCWVSAPISSARALNESLSSSNQQEASEQQQLRADNVTLTLNLDKKYEITYISMQFCSLKPDSLAIYKSADFGLSWAPYQFYSSQCKRLYGRPQSGQVRHVNLADVPAEATCVDLTASGNGQLPGAAGRVAFSTLDRRESGLQGPLERSSSLQEWTTATNIKIVLDRHQASWIHANQLAGGHHHAKANSTPASSANEQQQQASESSLTNPSDTYNYAMSDLKVGGRCKCNGHASRCVHARDGQLQCDCRHNTAGRDCERCAPFHFDRPWARATHMDANPCQPCNCNGHSRKCRFDPELYQLSGRRSGGVCLQCRHNTDGRHCHYCKEGFTRDHSKVMSDKEACKPCNCHPVGSKGRVCNQASGQCPCKEGVTGLECNRCAAGYQQSSSPSEPCIKLPENDINSEPELMSVDGSATNSQPADDSNQPVGIVGQAAQSETQTNPPADATQPELRHHLGRVPPGAFGARSPKLRQDHFHQDGGFVESAMLDLDKQDDDSDLDVDGGGGGGGNGALAFGAGSMRKPIPMRPAAGKPPPQHWRGGRYNKYYKNSAHRFSGSEDDDSSDMSDDLTGRLGRPRNSHPLEDEYDSRNHYSRYNPYSTRYHNDYPTGRRQAHLSPSMASLDHADDAMDDSSGTRSNVYEPANIYNEDAFNQIQPDAPLVAPSRPRSGPSLGGLGRHGGQMSSRRRPFDTVLSSNANELSSLQPNSISCGDCQSNTRRLGLRQFCHLDYAIKATILSRHVADDWTKVEVDIQDIFKSPASSAIAARSAVSSASGYQVSMDNALQSDEAVQSQASSRPVVGSDSNPTGDNQQPQLQSSGAKLKVGTVQTIWVPTEDLGCKCPKLKTRSTYLLMGSVDARENSANAIQLDRHGVAFEWKATLQSRLIKYQKRHSRGRCT